MESLSFDGMAELYDDTRRFDQPSFDAALDWLTAEFPPSEHPSVFEPGIGTGRIALPLAERGYRVDGIDLSPRMLAVLERRLIQSPVRPPVSYRVGDVLALPWPDAAFDLVVAVHLFYHIREWQTVVDELLRILRPGGAFVLMHTGTGSEIPSVNDRYRQLCAELGHTIDCVGVTSTRQVADYLESLGYPCRRVEGDWQWVEQLRLDVALGHIASRAYAFTAAVPETVHVEAVARLGAELNDRPDGPESAVDIPNQVYFVIAQL